MVDFGLYCLLDAGNLEELGGLARMGVVGYKCFLGETLGEVKPPSDGELLGGLTEAARLGMRVSVHAENDSIVRSLIGRLCNEGRSDARAHLESRPSVVEEEAVERVLALSKEVGCKVHIAHVSSERGAEGIRMALRDRVRVTAETCPHYLLLDDSRYGDLGSMTKVNPATKTSGMGTPFEERYTAER
jgi:dihydroorotase